MTSFLLGRKRGQRSKFSLENKKQKRPIACALLMPLSPLSLLLVLYWLYLAGEQETQSHSTLMHLPVEENPSSRGVLYPYPLDPPPADYNISKSYRPKGGGRYAEYADGSSPHIISEEIRNRSDDLARTRRTYIKKMMQVAWEGYTTYAWGYDELKPKSKEGRDKWGGIGITLIDSLDTLWLLGMKEEFWKGRDWVRDHPNHSKYYMASVFETTIRSMGGLLSAYDWSGDPVFLEQALDLGRRLIHSFNNTPTGMPFGTVNLQTGKTSYVKHAKNNVVLSEPTTMQIEFRFLDQVLNTAETADMRRKVERVYEIINSLPSTNGLYPFFLSNTDPDGIPKFQNDILTIGAMADSFYEYMLKVWIQGGKVEPLYREMYDRAVQGMHDELLQKTIPLGLYYFAEKSASKGTLIHKMQHLGCFTGGLLALGAYTDPLGMESERAQRDLKTAKAITYTCYQMYARTETGISPEEIQIEEGEDFDVMYGHYPLRPEVVESFFILHQITGDPVYREWGWEIFQSIEKYCRIGAAYGAPEQVNEIPPKLSNNMESFFLGETIKYMYLLQDPDTEVDVLNKVGMHCVVYIVHWLDAHVQYNMSNI